MQEHFILIKAFEHARASHALNPAHTCRDGGFRDDLKKAELRGIVHMRTAAQLCGEIPGPDDTDRVAIFFAEERHSALLFGLLQRHFLNRDRERRKDRFIDKVFHLTDFLRRHRLKVGEIEAHLFAVDHGARLLNVRAERFAQRRLQQVRSGMVAHCGAACFLIHLSRHTAERSECPRFQRAVMKEYTARRFGGMRHAESKVTIRNYPRIAHLPAALRVKRRAVEHEHRLLSGGDVFRRLPVPDGGEKRCLLR